MKQIHISEKEQFKKLFKQDQIDRYEDRFQILEVFLQTERHVAVEDLTRLLQDQGYGYTLDFVQDTLNLMCRYGFAQRNHFDNGQILYEHRHLGQHHDHMICTKCKRIIEFKDEQLEALQLKITAAQGFHMLQHKMDIYGICPDCLQARLPLIPLVTAKQGERLVIKDISGGTSMRMRLLTMGLRIGDEIEVISNQNQGQLVIAAGHKRYGLGRGLAQKIVVRGLTQSGS